MEISLITHLCNPQFKDLYVLYHDMYALYLIVHVDGLVPNNIAFLSIHIVGGVLCNLGVSYCSSFDKTWYW